MAFVDTDTQIPASTKIPTGSPFIYNVGMAVGPNCPNSQQDVMLVQYFLSKIWARGQTTTPPMAPQPDGTLVPDGFFGPITAAWILAFQNDAKTRFPTAVDGKVDKAPPGGSNQYVRYVILDMNTAFMVTYPEIPFNDIANNDPNCPPGLQSLFATVATPTVITAGTDTGTTTGDGS